MGSHARRDPLVSVGRVPGRHPRWYVAACTAVLALLLWGGVIVSGLVGPAVLAGSLTSELVKISVNMAVASCNCAQPMSFAYGLHGLVDGHPLADDGAVIGSATAYHGSEDLAYFEHTELLPVGAPVLLIISARDSAGQVYPDLARIDGTLPNCHCATLTVLLNAATLPGQPHTIARGGSITVSGSGTDGVMLRTTGALLALPQVLPASSRVQNEPPVAALLPPLLLLATLLATVIAVGSTGFELWRLYARATASLAR